MGLLWFVVSIAINILVNMYGTAVFSSVTIALITFLMFQRDDTLNGWDVDYLKIIRVIAIFLLFHLLINRFYTPYLLDMPLKELPPNGKYNLVHDNIYLRLEFFLRTVLLSPIAEEIYFRWFLIGKTKAKYKIPAIIISILLFSASHISKHNFTNLETQLIFQAIYLPSGLAFTFIFLRYGIVYSIAAHCLANFYPFLIELSPRFGLLLIVFILTGIVLQVRSILAAAGHSHKDI